MPHTPPLRHTVTAVTTPAVQCSPPGSHLDAGLYRDAGPHRDADLHHAASSHRQAPSAASPAPHAARAPAASAGRNTAPPQPPAPAQPYNRALGAHGETLAREFLTSQGFELLAHNWRCRHGELDLVMQEGPCLVAVEVKTRSGLGYGSPLEAITAQKAARLRRLLLEYVSLHGTSARRLRLDAVGITLLPGMPPRIDHLRGIS